MDFIECFELECNFNLILRLENCIVDSLATFVAVFKAPMHPSGKYEAEVRHIASAPDNVKSWKVFEDDKYIQKFLTLTGEFYRLSIDEENELLEESTTTQEPLQCQTIDPK